MRQMNLSENEYNQTLAMSPWLLIVGSVLLVALLIALLAIYRHLKGLFCYSVRPLSFV